MYLVFRKKGEIFYDESKADMIKDTMKHIAADMKDGLLFIKSKTEDFDMNQKMHPFANMPFTNMFNAPFTQQNTENEAESEE